jgi:hypothetical protein
LKNIEMIGFIDLLKEMRWDKMIGSHLRLSINVLTLFRRSCATSRSHPDRIDHWECECWSAFFSDSLAFRRIIGSKAFSCDVCWYDADWPVSPRQSTESSEREEIRENEILSVEMNWFQTTEITGIQWEIDRWIICDLHCRNEEVIASLLFHEENI